MTFKNQFSESTQLVNFKTVFDAFPGNCLILQPDAPHFTVLAISDELLEITHKKRPEVVGKSVFEVFPENPELDSASGTPDFRSSLEETCQSKKPSKLATYRYDVASASGIMEERYWSTVSKPVMGPEGEVLYIISSTVDITDQVILEKGALALKEVEKSFALLLQAPVAVCIVKGPDITIELTNEEMLKIWGKDRGIIGMPFFEAVPEAREQGLEELVHQVRKTGKPFYANEYPISLLKEGREEKGFYNFVYQPFYESIGDMVPSGVICVANEVTAQVEARKKIEESELQIRSFIESAPFPIAVYIGREMRIQFANQTMIESYGKGKEVIGRLYSEVLPELDPGIYKRLDEVFTTGIAYHRKNEFIDVVINGKSQPFYYNYSFTPLFDDNGKVYGVMNMAADVTELNLAHKKIEESENRFRNMVEQAPVAMALTYTKEGLIKNINALMLRIMGKKKEEVVGKSILQVLPELKGQQYLNEILKVLETGEAYQGVEVPVSLLIGNEPEEYFFNVSYSPLFEGGEITGVLHVAIDVTEEVKARKKVEEGARELKELANAMPQVVWIAESNGKVTYYNNRVKEFSGAKKMHDGTWQWEGVLFPEDKPATVLAWEKAVTEGSNYQMEHRLKMRNGSFRWHLSRAFPQRNEKGVIIKWFGTATDVHEQKENEEALRRSEEQLRIAVEGAELGTFYFYPQTGRKIWSHKTKELMGLPPEAEVSVESYMNAVHPEDRERCQALLQYVMKPESGGVYENEFRIKRFSDGEVRWLRSKGKVTFDEDQKPIFFNGVTQDITRRKKSEEVLEQKNIQLVRINNDLDNFIYTASHDLKAPILNIEGLLSVLMHNLPDEAKETEKVQRITGMMKESVERFKKTIANLTEVVKLQKENNRVAVPVSLFEVVSEVEKDLEPMIQEVGAQVKAEVKNCPAIHFSKKNLRSVVYNLLSNAIKYSSPDRVPRVHIHCEKSNEYHILTVKDNGLGMDKGTLGQLFTMFKRFHAHVEGTGIGLYMVKKMVENAGGHIEVESEIGMGTTFRVYFLH